MKTQIPNFLKLALASTMVAWLTGCTGEPNQPPVTKAASTNAASPAPAPTNKIEQAEVPVPKVPPQRPALPPEVNQIVELAQANVGDAVLLEYVKNSTVAYDLSVEQIIYLTDVGISENVLSSMIRHGNELREQAAQTTATAAKTQATETAPVQETQPEPGATATTETAVVAPAAQPAYAPAEPQPVQPPATQVTYNYFYQTLAPYGTWLETPDYGWCWQPTCAVVDPFWRPYFHRGHWLYTDCGWYWASDYSWGWAPFHYGRWWRSPRWGWVWAPGYVWGPSWVTWRHWDNYCGWAPLPPHADWHVGLGLVWNSGPVSVGFGFGLYSQHYGFVHYRHLLHPKPWQYHLARHEVAKVYDRSTVINNITIHNNTIVNRGMAPERVTAVTRREVPKVQLRDVSMPSQVGTVRPDRIDRDTGKLAVYRPRIPASQAGAGLRPAPVEQQNTRLRTEPRKLESPSSVPRRGTQPGALIEPSRLAPSRPELTRAGDAGREANLAGPSRPTPAAGAPGLSRAEAPSTAKSGDTGISRSPSRVATESLRSAPQAAASQPKRVETKSTGPSPSRPEPTQDRLSRLVAETPKQPAPIPQARPSAPSPLPGTSVQRPPAAPGRSSPAITPSPLVSTQPSRSRPNEPVAVLPPGPTRSPSVNPMTPSPRVPPIQQTPLPSPSGVRPSYTPAAPTPPTQRQFSQPSAPSAFAPSSPARPQIESSRSEPRKYEPPTPSYSPPKFNPAPSPAPSFGPGPSGSRVAPSAPQFSPPPSQAPNYSRPAPAPSFSPPRAMSAPPAPSQPPFSPPPSVRSEPSAPSRSVPDARPSGRNYRTP
jgi:hypothetical protein